MTLLELLCRELPKRGGWPEGAEKSTSYSHIPGVHFWDYDGFRVDYSDLTTRELGCEEVTREQYEAALAAKNDGWIKWGGGECPVPCGTMVEVKYRDEQPYHIKGINAAGEWNWRHDDCNGDIIAYRLHQSQQAEQPETSEEDINDCIGQALSTAWSDRWLPSAGCECEYQYKVHGSEWCSFECVAIDGNAAFGWSNNTPTALQLNTHNFRPLRTEAERAIDEMVRLSGVSIGAAKILYDAGYRK